MKVHILASRNIITHYFFTPVLAWRGELSRSGCRVEFFDAITPRLCDCDTLIIDSRFFTPFWRPAREKAIAMLEELRRTARFIIWADVTDSTGTTQFQVLPYVDRYWKKQLLRDRDLYLKDMYGARIYTHYYKNRFELAQEDAFRVEPLKAEFLPKLEVSWNLGLGPYQFGLKVNDVVRRLPWSVKALFPSGMSVDRRQFKDRQKDICFRGSDTYNALCLAYQRLEVKKRLHARGVATQPLPSGEYFRELRSSRVGVSPFGAGEVCFRDFEIIQSGAMLFKPDMSHLETWPSFFETGETYMPFKWDFSDFDAQLDLALSGADERERISQNARQRYLQAYAPQGRDEFCRRFLGLVKA